MPQILEFEQSRPSVELGAVAQRRLCESPYFFLKQIRCEYAAGVLTLRGTVPLVQLRQFAESIVSRVDGVWRIDNQVEVFDPMTAPFSERAVRNAG